MGRIYSYMEKNKMTLTDQMPVFCVIYAMHLMLWLLFEKMKQGVKNKSYAKNNE